MQNICTSLQLMWNINKFTRFLMPALLSHVVETSFGNQGMPYHQLTSLMKFSSGSLERYSTSASARTRWLLLRVPVRLVMFQLSSNSSVNMWRRRLFLLFSGLRMIHLMRQDIHCIDLHQVLWRCFEAQSYSAPLQLTHVRGVTYWLLINAWQSSGMNRGS
jgi:hypothetical protein